MNEEQVYNFQGYPLGIATEWLTHNVCSKG